MEIVLAHNFYQQPGGEDQVFQAEVELLRSRGHDVRTFIRDNDDIQGMGKLSVAKATIWNRDSAARLRDLLQAHRPQVVHFHNTFPLISPAAYAAARAAGAAVVQTLHNFRLLCVNALFFRDGNVCEDCMGSAVPWRGVLHKCYRGSRSASAGVAGMVAVHRALGTWRDAVDSYIVLSNSSQRKFVEGGLPPEKLVVKPNFVFPDPGTGAGCANHAVYVGRLSHEKGVNTLLRAWSMLKLPFQVKILGDGPEALAVRSAAANNPQIQWQGRRPLNDVYVVMRDAQFAVVPSVCYENFPRAIAEAFATGTPVIASNLGAMAELVEHGRTGLLFQPGDPQDLAAKISEFLAMPPEQRQAMRRAARAEYEAKYTAGRNYEMMMNIYRTAVRRAEVRRT